jgi:hypothetical protein
MCLGTVSATALVRSVQDSRADMEPAECGDSYKTWRHGRQFAVCGFAARSVTMDGMVCHSSVVELCRVVDGVQGSAPFNHCLD